MAKKIKINLSLSKDQLWWSSDGGVNWAPVTPESPTTIVQKDCEIQWVCDNGSIDDIDITIDDGDVLHPPTGSKKEKSCKVNDHCKNKSVSKYTITVNGKYKVDPPVKLCDPPCIPGGDG